MRFEHSRRRPFRFRLALRSLAIFVATAAITGIASQGSAVVMDDFEDPPHTAGNHIVGTNGWDDSAGDPSSGVVTPSGTDTTVLAGSQSYKQDAVPSGNTYWLSKQFGTSAANVIQNAQGSQITFSYRVEASASSSNPEVYFSDNVSGGQTPLGLRRDPAANSGNGAFETFNGSGFQTSSTPFSVGNEYLVEVVMSFPASANNELWWYATGPDTSGRELIANRLAGSHHDASEYADDGGIFMITRENTGAAVFDNFEVVPEPASLALMGFSGIVLLTRRR